MNGSDQTVLHASRGKAFVLLAIGTLVMVVLAGMDWFRESERGLTLAALFFGVGIFAYFAVFAMALLLRRRPVFTANAAGLGMPTGSAALVHLPWSEIAGYGVVKRKMRFSLGILSSTAFGVWLRPGVAVPGRFTDAQLREFRLNRHSMGPDVILTHWYAPRGFGEALAAARACRPDLERSDPDAAPTA